MARKAGKKPTKKPSSGIGKKCKKCSFDCEVNRRKSSQKYDTKPAYTVATCPKK